jgi:glycosyltransferase involved in cell wall biosynthesis
MRRDLWEKRRALRRAGAVLAVSEAIGGELRAACFPRVEVIPNVLDAAESRATAEPLPSFELPERFLLFVGKLEENKGARLLVPAVAAAKTGLPLLILGEGTLTHSLRFEAASRDVNVIQKGWAGRDEVLRVMSRATVLVFPSLWPEPLSRVLLEGLALGTPIAAMDTGGTREILTDGKNGLLVDGVAPLGEAVARLVGDEGLRQRLGEGARARAEAFSTPTAPAGRPREGGVPPGPTPRSLRCEDVAVHTARHVSGALPRRGGRGSLWLRQGPASRARARPHPSLSGFRRTDREDRLAARACRRG